jgi:hypothetical protein
MGIFIPIFSNPSYFDESSSNILAALMRGNFQERVPSHEDSLEKRSGKAKPHMTFRPFSEALSGAGDGHWFQESAQGELPEEGVGGPSGQGSSNQVRGERGPESSGFGAPGQARDLTRGIPRAQPLTRKCRPSLRRSILPRKRASGGRRRGSCSLKRR